MYTLSSKVKEGLLKFNQKKLEKGEIFLLAKAIADELPLCPVEEENVKYFVLNHKLFIDHVVYALNEYSYLDEVTKETIFKLICDLTLWRYKVAYEPPYILFRGEYDVVLDDISTLPRYVDMTYVCSVADIVDRATYLYSLFRDFVKEIKMCVLE